MTTNKFTNTSKSGERHLNVRIKDNKKRTASSRRWLERQLNDPYVARAQADGYKSRAAFKLLEIEEKFHLLKPGYKVIDLGAAPGGWSQVAAHKVSKKTGGHVIAIDLNLMESMPHVTFIQGDFNDSSCQNQIIELLGQQADIILSDMAAPACGMPSVDHLRIIGLLESAYDFALQVLKPGGHLVAKVLQGGTEAELLRKLKSSFIKVEHFKPPASRKGSAELYVIASGFRPIKEALGLL